ncbi:MAG: patatin-like phospholipase family protein [Methylococcales bacterium]|nr:patatin-like phospholipase family protein [Methylococcales bacterium]
MHSNASKVGLVLSGGGAKGAYQVGVLRFMAEAGMNVHAVSGASIGALNGAIVANAKNLTEASQHLYELWQLLADEPPLKFKKSVVVPYLGFLMLLGSKRFSPELFTVMHAVKLAATHDLFEGIQLYVDLFKFDAGIFDHSPVRTLIERYTSPESLQNGLPLYISAYESEDLLMDLSKTFAAALGISETNASDFFHVQSFPIEKQQDVIIASAALPFLFAAQKINGKFYSDGGIGGWTKSQGNTPITPLVEQANCTHVIVTHLTDGSFWNRYDFPDTTILEVRPKQPLAKEGMAKDLLGFKADKINQWIEQGYEDASRCIGNISKVMQLQTAHQLAKEKHNQAIASLEDNFFID